MTINALADQPLQPGSVAAILPAAGQSRRFGGEDKKIFAVLDDAPVWEHSVRRLRARPEIGRIIVAIDAGDRPRWEGEFAGAVAHWQVTLVAGGAERVDSVRAGLEAAGDAVLVAVHDAARPFVPDEDIAAVLVHAAETGAAILATPVRGTMKRHIGSVAGIVTVDRRDMWEALTPQVFRTEVLRHAYQRWRGRPVTDDAQLVELSGQPVYLVPGSPENIKITRAEDLRVLQAILQSDANR